MSQLLVDNGSIYTNNLYSLLTDINCDPIRLEPDRINLDSLSRHTSFVLSGRRENDKNVNRINSKIISHAIKNSKPLLGICYGAEIIALSCGGAIKKMKAQRNGTYTIVPAYTDPMYIDPICPSSMNVFESHKYRISTLSQNLVPVAESNDCKYEIIRVTDTAVYGTQFHPEMSNDGRKIVEGFMKRHLEM